MSDDYQVLSDIVKSKDAALARLREREAQLEEGAHRRGYAKGIIESEARVQELEAVLRMLRGACSDRLLDGANQQGWIRADWVDEEARRALEPRADG